MIQLSDALKKMGKEKFFDISFVVSTGEIINLKSVSLSNKMRSGENATGGATGIKKAQNHYDNSTRNLILPNGQIRKIHIRLILRLNGEPVVY